MGGPSRPSLPPIWLLPNLLSLDAPLVALVWQDFLARVTDTPLRLAARIVLGLTVWAIYLADRLLDVRLPAGPREAPRHQFYRHHRTLAVLVLVAVFLVDAGFTLTQLRPLLLRNGLLILAAVLLYLVAIHGRLRVRLPKEVAVALIFTAGTFLVAWSWSPRPFLELFAPALIFCLLCLANLVAIESWEWHELREEKAGRPQKEVLALSRWLGPSLAALCVGCLSLGALWPIYWPAGASAGLLWALLWAGRRIPLNVRRVLVDVVLLTPLLFLR